MASDVTTRDDTVETADGPRPRHRVVIVGGGFGGLPATRLLGGKGVDVTLIDRRNHHLFQPLLYQTATGLLSPGQIAPALRHIVRKSKNVRVHLAEVIGIDLARRVVFANYIGHDQVEYPYDSLIVAAGVKQSYFGNDQLVLYAPAMKTLDDALELRRRILGAFEMAEMITDPAEKEHWLTIVVVGAGPTGVELAGQIRELATRSLRRYRDLGSVATIGRFRAVVSVKGIRLSGFPGWVVWMFVHLAFLTGFGNRLTTMMRWLRSMIGRGRPEREFGVAHTGGDLSLPDSVLRLVQPSQFPVYEATAPPVRPIEQRPS